MRIEEGDARPATTSRLAKLARRFGAPGWLSPVPVPFVLTPRREGDALRWYEIGGGRAREMYILSSVFLGLGVPMLLCLPTTGVGPGHHPVVLWATSIILVVSGGGFVAAGRRIAGRVRILEIRGRTVRLIERRGDWPEVVEADLAACRVIAHPLRFSPPRAPDWEGHVAIMSIGDGRATIALAAVKSAETIGRYIDEWAARGVGTGWGEQLKMGVSVSLNRRARRIGQGRCPNCDFDLQGRFLGGCPECGWPRQSEPRFPAGA